MTLKEELSKDDYNRSQRNRRKAEQYFIEIGLLPKDRKPFTYVMHHKDETLRHTDIKRYIEWNIDDLEIESYSEHSKHHRSGKVVSDETKAKLRMINLGANSPVYGTHHSKEHNQLIRENQPNKKAVICLTTGLIYPSINEASRQTGAAVSAISSCCSSRKKSTKGCHWKYYEEV